MDSYLHAAGIRRRLLALRPRAFSFLDAAEQFHHCRRHIDPAYLGGDNFQRRQGAGKYDPVGTVKDSFPGRIRRNSDLALQGPRADVLGPAARAGHCAAARHGNGAFHPLLRLEGFRPVADLQRCVRNALSGCRAPLATVTSFCGLSDAGDRDPGGGSAAPGYTGKGSAITNAGAADPGGAAIAHPAAFSSLAGRVRSSSTRNSVVEKGLRRRAGQESGDEGAGRAESGNAEDRER